ncbi:MAG TPA: pyridoxamine 5'-phosphate oxidase [Nevskiaceae bacterium]|nr:pyridoxamine 5'-phosphate oxidase [Nevskiaceae bacterium]
MQYTKNPPLLEPDLLRDPRKQFERWLADAMAARMKEPTAMTLATVDARGRPHARVVLFKGFRDGGFSFFTSYASAKGSELAATERAALVFWWDKLERSVRIEGRVKKLSRAEALAYFRTRPRGSQLGALVSRQSRAVRSRAELDARYRKLEKELEGRAIPLPATWGGYTLLPASIEFWQGRHGRLHDRLRYRKSARGWIIERLEP